MMGTVEHFGMVQSEALTNLSVQSFVAQLASGAPTPGGGAAAALSGALAVALIEMVCNLTIGKRKYQHVEAEVREARRRAEELRIELLRLVEEDAAAYQQVADAYRLPRGSIEEQERRGRSIQVALRAAAQPPLSVAQACREALALAEVVARSGNVNVVSDAGVAAHLALAGVRGAGLNVEINLNGIRDEEFVTKIRRTLIEVNDAATSLAEIVAVEVQRKMRPTSDG